MNLFLISQWINISGFSNLFRAECQSLVHGAYNIPHATVHNRHHAENFVFSCSTCFYNQCLSPYKHCRCLFLLCRGITESELQEHMKKMHEYNELKDIGQMLLGKLGNWIDYSVVGGLRVDRFIPPLSRGQEVAKCGIHHYYVPHRICVQNEIPSPALSL